MVGSIQKFTKNPQNNSSLDFHVVKNTNDLLGFLHMEFLGILER